MKVIYVDILLLINFIIDLLLLRCCAFLGSRKFKMSKCVLAAFLGSLSALTIFLPRCSFMSGIFYKLMFSSVMIFVSFGCDSLKGFIKDVFCLFTVSLIFSGFMLFIYLTLRPERMIVFNGAVYFDISAVFLLSCASASFVLVSFLDFILKRRKPSSEICLLTLNHGNKVLKVKALIDSGCSLQEPFSHLPVAVLEKDSFKDEIKKENAVKNSFRMIPFGYINGEGALPAFLADSVTVETFDGRKVKINKGCYIALTDKKIGSGSFRAVINPEIIKEYNFKE